MKALALYLSSRGTMVNSTSRAGRAIAKFAMRRPTWNATTTDSTGQPASSANPITVMAGVMQSVTATPSRSIAREARNSWASNVTVLTTRSIRANSAARAARFEMALATMWLCWNVRKVDVSAYRNRYAQIPNKYAD